MESHGKGSFHRYGCKDREGGYGRAVLEGVGFNLKVILDILEERQRIEALNLIGGGAKGKVWPRILADIWGKPLRLPVYSEEATSLGAAVCGGVGIGIYPDYRVIKKLNRTADTIRPKAARTEIYERYYEIFDQAYEALQPVYEKLAQIRKADA